MITGVGLCSPIGNDLDEATTPVEADLAWSIQRRRREEGGFLGAEVIQRQLAQGTDRIRVGIRAEGRRPIRDGAPLLVDDAPVGRVTSGGHGPTFGGPVAMGYLPPSLSTPGTALVADVRGKTVPCVVAELPFVPHRYRRS